MSRSRVEMMGLQYEAEMLVRSGVSRAEVAQMLEVHPQTLAAWALQGKWRRKDLDLERSGPTTQRTIRNIATAHERRRVARQTLEAQAKVVRQAVRLIAEKGPGAEEELVALIAGVRGLPGPEGLPEKGLRTLPAEVPEAGRSLGEYRGVRKRRKNRAE